MKTGIIFKAITAVITSALLITSCELDNLNPRNKEFGILPEKFKIDIPSSLSNENFKSTSLKSTENDTVRGNTIYSHLNTFIAVGEGASDIVEAVILAIKVYNIEDVIFLSYTSDEDNRVKNLEVVKTTEFKGRTWEYQLTITDVESTGNEDGGKAMQVFWNNNPIEGIAIIKPYNLNRKENPLAPDAIFSVEYSEMGNEKYDSYMIVEIAGLPVIRERFGMETLKMYVGKKGEIIDVYGNSNHPNAQFNYNNEKSGFNWAFVASGDKTNNIAVAEVGLPASNANISERTEILVENSIREVLTREMTDYIVTEFANAGITLNPGEIAAYLSPYLKNAEAPGYFKSHGFVQGGTAPGEGYSILETRIETLVPYNPSEISNLVIEFK